MCCDTTMCGAQSEALHFALAASRVTSWHQSARHRAAGETGRHDVSRGCVPEVRRSSEEEVNPVRWCARRRLVGVAVAWAAPLFSDDAPREVHLWQ